MTPEPSREAVDLKPCPFCGRDHRLPIIQDEASGLMHVYCQACGASGPVESESEAEAIAGWNRRVGASSPGGGPEKKVDMAALREDVYAAHRAKLIRRLPEAGKAFALADKLEAEGRHHRAAYPKGNMAEIMFAAANQIRRQAEQIGILTESSPEGSQRLREAAQAVLKSAARTMGGLYPEDCFVSRDALDELRHALAEPSVPTPAPTGERREPQLEALLVEAHDSAVALGQLKGRAAGTRYEAAYVRSSNALAALRDYIEALSPTPAASVPPNEANRCPNHHYLSGCCCQLDVGHKGPCIAESGTMPMWCYAWHQPEGEPACNQRPCPNPEECACG